MHPSHRSDAAAACALPWGDVSARTTVLSDTRCALEASRQRAVHDCSGNKCRKAQSTRAALQSAVFAMHRSAPMAARFLNVLAEEPRTVAAWARLRRACAGCPATGSTSGEPATSGYQLPGVRVLPSRSVAGVGSRGKLTSPQGQRQQQLPMQIFHAARGGVHAAYKVAQPAWLLLPRECKGGVTGSARS